MQFPGGHPRRPRGARRSSDGRPTGARPAGVQYDCCRGSRSPGWFTCTCRGWAWPPRTECDVAAAGRGGDRLPVGRAPFPRAAGELRGRGFPGPVPEEPRPRGGRGRDRERGGPGMPHLLAPELHVRGRLVVLVGHRRRDGAPHLLRPAGRQPRQGGRGGRMVRSVRLYHSAPGTDGAHPAPFPSLLRRMVREALSRGKDIRLPARKFCAPRPTWTAGVLPRPPRIKSLGPAAGRRIRWPRTSCSPGWRAAGSWS